jgi:KaiC/GvpD/RAD55 family RecA-like ATPase
MLNLIHPFTMIVCGPTQSGKTVFVLKIIENVNKHIQPAPKKILYCYTEYQPAKFDNFASRGVNFSRDYLAWTCSMVKKILWSYWTT